MEYWMEENIKPNTPNDMDRVLFYQIRPIVYFLKRRSRMLAWHFLRESGNWRGNPQVVMPHIRFRVRAESETNLNQAQIWVTKVLDGLQNVGIIADHYLGNHGNPNQTYQGERGNFDEIITGHPPQGWDAIQTWLQSGSEIELVFLSNVFRRAGLGARFNLPDILHFFANQCNRNHDWTINGRFMIVAM